MSYHYQISENGGRTFATVAVVGDRERALIERAPVSSARVVRRFVPTRASG